MKNPVIVLLFVSILFWISCAGGFYQRKRVFISDQIAVYFIDADDYPEEELQVYLKPVQTFPPYALEDLQIVLQSLEVEKKGIFSTNVYPLLYPRQLEEVLNVLKDIIPDTPENTRILIVQRFDPFQTILSKYKRITFLLWYDKDGYNLLFGEIHEDLIPDNFSTEVDWLDIFPISFQQGNPDQKILPFDQIQYKKVGDFTHYSWIVFTHEQAQALKSKESSTKKQLSQGNIEDRLRKLKKLYQERLITKQEYESKKKQILSEL